MKEAMEMIRDWPVGERQDWELTARTMVAMARKSLADTVATRGPIGAVEPEDAAVLLRKYKKLCIEISRGDSYHLARIDAAILSLATPVVQGEPVAPIKCALCGDKARIPPVCDACHDSMGTRATPAPSPKGPT